MKTIERERWLTHLVAAACCVVATRRDVRSITIVTNRRPTFQHLSALHDHAASCAAQLSAADRNSIVVRRSAQDNHHPRNR